MKAPAFAVDDAGDGIECEHLALNGHYVAIILDLMLPRRDGFSMLWRLRNQKNVTPVLILTARGGTESIRLLNPGAEDCLTRPFDLGELRAWIKVPIRRAKGDASSRLNVLDLDMNTVERTIVRSGMQAQPHANGIQDSEISHAQS